MADAAVFDVVCNEIETRSSLDRLAARGTLRIALKLAGLDSRTVTPEQMAVAVEKLLVGELSSRGIDDAARVCAEIAAKARRFAGAPRAETPDSVFRRLGG